MTPEGLRAMKEVNIHGKITVLKLFRPPQQNKDQIFLLTNKYNVAILEGVRSKKDGEDIDILTKAHGTVADQISKPAETGSKVVIDPSQRYIGLRLYDGLFKVIPLDKENKELKAFNIRMEELSIQDIQFLHGTPLPTIAFIYQEGNARHVKTYEVNGKEKEFMKGPWKQDNVESETAMLIPVPEPFGGAIFLGQDSICYHDGEKYKAIAPPLLRQSTVTCYCRVDDNRYLIGDMSGRLFLLLLEQDEDGGPSSGRAVVKDVKLELLGEVSIPECLTYLDNGVVYVGSRLGNSQLVRLLVEQNEDESFIEIMESFPNLGPIVDMCVVDIEKQGQGQLITCSGAYKEGSLRIIRNGIGIQEHASIELPGIKGIWPLRLNSDRYDNVLVVSFVGESRFLTISPDDVSGVAIEGFTDSEQTFTSGNVVHNQIIQVTASGIRLASASNGRLLDQWSPSGENKISVVANNECQVICAVRETVYYLEINEGKLLPVSSMKMEFEVACLDITPLNAESTARICAVGFWTEISLSILSLPNLACLTNHKLEGEVFIPRSIMLATFDNGSSHYLLSALGDGSLFYFSLNPVDGSLKEKKKVTLGTQPTVLRSFKSSSSSSNEMMNSINSNIFACSDRPTVIYSSSHKLLFSNVNLKQVNHMSSLNAEAYPESLALANDSCLLIGRIDEIQKLHIRTIPLGETPRRIAYQESSKTFGLITQRHDLCSQSDQGDLHHPMHHQSSSSMKPIRESASTCAVSTSRAESSFARNTATNDVNMEIETYNLLILDQHTFEVLHAHTFLPGEVALSVISSSLGPGGSSNETFYVVGTCFCNPEEPEPKLGRLIVFLWKSDQQKLLTITEKEIKGAPYQLAGWFRICQLPCIFY